MSFLQCQDDPLICERFGKRDFKLLEIPKERLLDALTRKKSQLILFMLQYFFGFNLLHLLMQEIKGSASRKRVSYLRCGTLHNSSRRGMGGAKCQDHECKAPLPYRTSLSLEPPNMKALLAFDDAETRADSTLP